jgi:lipoate synthase
LQIIDTMVDLKEAGVDILTFGQYLQPTPQHLTVKDFITPEKFEHWRTYGEQVIGFRCCCCSTALVVCSSAARLPTRACVAL